MSNNNVSGISVFTVDVTFMSKTAQGPSLTAC